MKVRDAILSMMHFPVGMELFGAANEEQWEIIKETIDTSDYYVLIVGNRYGSIIKDGDDAGISYTEKEFNYALSIGIPVLAFLSDKTVPINPDKIEGDKIRKKLAKFREKVMTGRTVDTWTDKEDLANKVSTALYKQFTRTPRPGWIRGDSVDVAGSLNTIVGLNEKVRKLEEENRELRRNSVSRRPILNISISCNETVEEAEDRYKGWHNSEDRDPDNPKFEMQEDELVIHMQRIPKSGHLGNTDELTMEDVPEYLRDIIDEGQLQEYNENLPDKDEVDAYERQVYRYKTVKENGIVLDIDISNDGNVKATNIHVDLTFPESFVVIEKAEAIDLAVKKRPKLPENPIEKADEMYQRKRVRRIEDPLRDYVRQMGAVMPLLPISNGVSASVYSALSNFDAGWNVHAEHHEAHIWKNSLMHTYHWSEGEFCIAPTEEGEFTVGITAICEELGEPIKSEFAIKVIDEGYAY